MKLTKKGTLFRVQNKLCTMFIINEFYFVVTAHRMLRATVRGQLLKIGKYTKDYRLSDRLDKKGRVRTSAEYIGDYYRLADVEAGIGFARVLVVLSVLGWFCFAVALIPQSRAAHLMYAVLPHVFAAIPLYTVSVGAVTVLRRGRGKLIHSDSDKPAGRLRNASIVGTVLTALILIALAVTYFVGSSGFSGGDAVFAACEAALCGVFFSAYVGRKKFDMKKISNGRQ